MNNTDGANLGSGLTYVLTLQISFDNSRLKISHYQENRGVER